MEQLAPPEQLYRQPANEAVARFLGFQNIINLATAEPFLPEKLIPAEANKLLIRPEAATIVTQDQQNPTDNILCGIVTKRIFQGQMFQIEMKVGENCLNFSLPIDPSPPRIGQEIILSLNPAAIVPLNGEG